MGLSLALVGAAKTFGLMGIGQTFITTPMVATLIWPFVLKVLLNLRPFNQIFINTVHSSRLFFFQMGQITSDPGGDDNSDRRRTRWERAMMLVNQRLVFARTSQWGDDDEESLRAVSVLAL